VKRVRGNDVLDFAERVNLGLGLRGEWGGGQHPDAAIGQTNGGRTTTEREPPKAEEGPEIVMSECIKTGSLSNVVLGEGNNVLGDLHAHV
jgi:hypothetical protein